MWKLIIVFLCLHVTVTAQLSADFSASVLTGCNPLTVQFKDLSTGGATSWFWDFGNGQTSYEQNPVIIYTKAGSFTVRLILRNATEQTFKEKVQFINVAATPILNFAVSPADSGCAPLQPLFLDQSGIPPGEVKSRVWDFGDGTTSSELNPTHLYSNLGAYDVSLTIETADGCIVNNVKPHAIKVGTKPSVSFSASPLEGCASKFRNFKNQSSTGVSGFLWDFGDGGTSNERNPSYHYQDTGTFTVALTVSNNGCKESTEKKNYITVTGPLAKIKTDINCLDRFTVQFQDKSIIGSNRFWDFDDGQTAVEIRPVHVFSNKGKYVVKLTVEGTTCNDTAYDTVYIKTGNPAISIIPLKNSYCKNDSLTFFVTNFDSINTRTFAWDLGDSITAFNSNYQTINYSYAQNGSFIPIVYIRNEQGCKDTIVSSKPVTINGPTANFISDLQECTNSLINLSDKSVSGNNQSINQWLWSYGDGTTSTDKNPLNYTYLFPGIYNINLKITDVNNCTDTISKSIEIFNSPTVSAGNDTLVCATSPLTLNPTGATSYIWNTNSDLSCTSCTNPVAKPNQPVTYFVTGTSNGCSDSDSINISVITKQTISAPVSSYTLCAGDTVGLSVSGTDRYRWIPASTLSNSISATPLAFPSESTVYTVIGNDDMNCFADTALISVNVNSKPNVDIKESYVQLITGSQYTIFASVSNDAQNLQWTPATGLSCNNCLQPATTVYNTTAYTLRATNSFGCSDSDKIVLSAICTDKTIFIPNTFSPNNDGMNDYFFPRSEGDPVIRSFTIFNRLGEIVFQKRNVHANNSAEGWNGNYNGKPQNPDIYIYVMEILCSGNTPFIKKGSISLVR